MMTPGFSFNAAQGNIGGKHRTNGLRLSTLFLPGLKAEGSGFTLRLTGPKAEGTGRALHIKKLRVPSLSREAGLSAAEWVKDVLDMEIGLKHPLLRPESKIKQPHGLVWQTSPHLPDDLE